MKRRPHGSGHLYIKHGAYYGRWRGTDGRFVNRRIGRVRKRGEKDGITKSGAERGLRRLVEAERRRPSPVLAKRAPTVDDVPVSTEDPALSTGPNKVVFWSYPIVKDGLMYVIDIRNGLFILKCTGPHHGRVQGTKFREGNSDIGVAGNTLNFDSGR